MWHSLSRFASLVLISLTAQSAVDTGTAPESAPTAAGNHSGRVEGPSWSISRTEAGWRLLRGGEPFFIAGAVAPDRFHLLRECGGNAVRTNASRATLDAARAAGLAVMANLPLRGERDGIDWDDERQFATQKDRVLAIVRERKDHPALMFWALGNELDHIPGNKPYNRRLWARLNDLARAVKAIDPDHPVMTVVGTGRFEAKIREIAADLPDLDLLGLNAYGDLAQAAALAREHWPRPYVITEWGPTGHWEVPKTPWRAPVEQSSSEKARVIADRYREVILADRTHCLGSFVFYWSEKQETTHTWYGLFLNGLRTESIDVMQHAWTGTWPANRAPSIKGIAIEGQPDPRSVRLRPGQAGAATAPAIDPDSDPLTYAWDIRPEVVIPPGSYAGGLERPARPIAGVIADPSAPRVTFTAPREPGPYRLFVAITDGQGHVAYANVPLLVQE